MLHQTSQMLSLLLAKVAHISSIRSGIPPKHSVSSICHVGSAGLQSGAFTF